MTNYDNKLLVSHANKERPSTKVKHPETHIHCTHLSGSGWSIQQQMGQIIIVNQPRQNRYDVLMGYEILERCRPILFDPWHLHLLVTNLRTLVLDYAGSCVAASAALDVHFVLRHGGGVLVWR